MHKPQLSELSPAVRQVMTDNHFEPVQLLRYGPRFVCCVVRHGDRTGLFKMVLPLQERNAMNTGSYVWTEYDAVDRLEQRLVKEALFLQFFSQELGEDGFEPQIIALSETSPVWSLRTFIDAKTMAAWDSNFVFSPRFFKTFTPRQTVDFFAKLHRLSPILPQNLSSLINAYTSTLINRGRFDRTADRARAMPQFKAHADHLRQRFYDAVPQYEQYDRVIAHYEPYAPHIFSQNGKMGLIDWENVGWGHKLQDLSVLYMRCFTHPDWQQEYVTVMREYGYFEGNGQLYWDSELLIQSFANHLYFTEGGPVGTPEYDKRAEKFFMNTVAGVLANSKHFGL